VEERKEEWKAEMSEAGLVSGYDARVVVSRVDRLCDKMGRAGS